MLKEAIQLAGGPDHIVAFVYDNAGRTLFVDEPFEMSMIQGNFIVIPDEDISGVCIKAYKPIETIQTIVTVDNLEERAKIDKHYIRN